MFSAMTVESPRRQWSSKLMVAAAARAQAKIVIASAHISALQKSSADYLSQRIESRIP
jgi:hypothetical protein